MGEMDGDPPIEADSLNPPVHTTGKYHVLMELGRGGTAVVHAAMARGLGGFSKLVVLKMTRQELGDRPEAVRMFLNEARLSARMNHPNVVQVYEVYEDQGLPVIVMEYLEGQPFSTVLRRFFADPNYNINLALAVLCKALEGLHYAHSLTDFSGKPLKIIHRDVTPHNIMVTYDGQVKLLDFGIAKLDAMSGETKTGIIKGKLGYMPREQVDGTEIDCRTDVFAIGVIMWEVVAKRRMWGTLSDAAVIKHLLCDEIPSLRQAAPDVNPELEAIINKAIAADPDARYRDAQQLLDAMHAYLQKHGGIPTQTQIADLVNRTCAELKAESRARLDRELAKFSKTSDGNWDDVPAEFTGSGPRNLPPVPAAEGSGRWRRQGADTGTSTGYVGQTRSSMPRVKRQRWPVVLGLCALAAGLLATWKATLSSPPAVEPAPKVAVTPPAPPEPAPPTSIQLMISAEPRTAALFLDGVRLTGNPYSGSRVADDREHELKVEAPGFVSETRTLRLDRDVDISLALAEVPKPPEPPEADEKHGSKRKVASAPPPRRRPPPRPARPKPVERTPDPPAVTKPAAVDSRPDACSPPYYIDGQGIKRYKRECLGR